MIARLISAACAAALLATGCTVAGDEPSARLAALLDTVDDPPAGIALVEGELSVLVLPRDIRGTLAVEQEGSHAPASVDPLRLIARAATPDQLTAMGAMLDAVEARTSRCSDANGLAVALGPDGPPLIMVGCGRERNGAQISIGDVTLSPDSSMLSEDAVRLVWALADAMGSPRVHALTLTDDAAQVTFAWQDGPNPCTLTVRIRADGVSSECDPQITREGEPIRLAAYPAGDASVGLSEGAAALDVESPADLTSATLVLTDPDDPTPVWRLAEGSRLSTAALGPDAAERVAALNARPSSGDITFPDEVAGFTRAGSDQPGWALYEGPGGRKITVGVLGRADIPLSAASAAADGLWCLPDAGVDGVTCHWELGDGGSLTASMRLRAMGEPLPFDTTSAATLLTAIYEEAARR